MTLGEEIDALVRRVAREGDGRHNIRANGEADRLGIRFEVILTHARRLEDQARHTAAVQQGTAAVTGPQERELIAMLREPQATFGSARSRVQNKLVAMGLAEFWEAGPPHVHGDRCRLTAAGRTWIAAQRKAGR